MEQKAKSKQIELINKGDSQLGDRQNSNLFGEQDDEALLIDEGTYNAADSSRPFIDEKSSNNIKPRVNTDHDGLILSQHSSI